MAPTFERLVREFLSAHPDLRHEWRQVPSWLAGDRLDLIFTPPAPDVPEVWATVREWTIAVGAGPDYHQDFEDFGRGYSDEAIAREAYDHLLALLAAHAYLQRE
jgi:hypothetical protein